jgi:hypothetical protein
MSGFSNPAFFRRTTISQCIRRGKCARRSRWRGRVALTGAVTMAVERLRDLVSDHELGSHPHL